MYVLKIGKQIICRKALNYADLAFRTWSLKAKTHDLQLVTLAQVTQPFPSHH